MGSRAQQIAGAALIIAGFAVAGIGAGLPAAGKGTWLGLSKATLAKIGVGLKIAGAGLSLSGQRRAFKDAQARAADQPVRGQTVTQRGGTTGAVVGYGETIVGGTIVEFRTHNDDANESYDAYMLIAHAVRRGGIEGLSGFYLDDNWIPYPGSWEGGLATRARGAAHGGVPTGDYEPRDWGMRFSSAAGDGAVVMRFSDGSRAGGPPHLVAKFSDWTASAAGQDIVWSEWVLKLRKESAGLFGAGPMNVRAVLKLSRVYDPRKDSTREISSAATKGTGSHRLDDRSTWEWSDNPALAWVDYAFEHSHLRFALHYPEWAAATAYDAGDIVRTTTTAGSAETWWKAKTKHQSVAGDVTTAATATTAAQLAASRWQELPDYAPRDSTRVDWVSVATAADRCDALVPIPGGGTEKRWRCDCALSLGRGKDLHKRNMSAILASMGGQALRIGDKWHVLAPGTAGAGPTFRAANVGEFQLASNLPASERANTVAGSFISRDHDWAVLDTPARRDAQAIDRDGETALDIPGQAVTRNTQMQRLCALALQRQSLQEVFTGLLDWSGIQLQPDAGFVLDLPLFPAPKRFRVDSMTLLHADAPVSVTAFEDEDDVYDDLAAADYHALGPDGEVSFAQAAPFAPTAFAATAADRAIVWSWVSPPIYNEIVLYTAATANWDDAAEAWRGRASEAVLPATPGQTTWGWVRAVGANGRESARAPNDDVSSVSATALVAAPPIYEALADDACPPADRGEHGQLWITPDGRVFEHRSIFAAPPPDQSTVTVDGVDGVLFGADGLAFTGQTSRFGGLGTTVYKADPTNETPWAALNAALTVSPATYVTELIFFTARSAHHPRRFGLYLHNATAGRSDDLAAEIEPHLFAAVRFPDGQAAWWRFDDSDDPYRSDETAQRAVVDAQFAGPSIDLDFRAGRLDKLCGGDPLNPWQRRPSLGVVGTTYREVALYKAQARATAAPAAPAVTWTVADGVFTVSPLAGWSAGPALPAWNDETQFLWCSVVLLSSQGTSANGTPPVVCDDPGDVNIVFRRHAGPGTPADTTGRVPADWSDTVPDETDPPLPLWMSVGRRQVGAVRFTWSSPVRAEGQDGDDGADGATTEQAFAVTATNAAPAALLASRNYRAGDAAPDNPVAGRAYRTRPALSADEPYGWVNSRTVSGSPAQGEDVGDVAWNGWVLTEHLGEDGTDGRGREWAFAVTATSAAPRALTNREDYDSFDPAPSRGPQAGTVYDDFPGVSAALPFGWINSRRVPGSPAQDAPHQSSWGDWGGWTIHEHYGADGADGTDGEDGEDAATVSPVSVTRFWADVGRIASVAVQWYRGGTRIAGVNLVVDGRTYRGVRQCRMGLSGLPSGETVRVDNVVRTGSTYQAPWRALDCAHVVEIAGVGCDVLIAEPPAAPTSTERSATVFFSWASGHDYVAGDIIVFRSGGVRWDGATVYRCVRAHTASSSNRPPAASGSTGATWQTYWADVS